MTRTLDERMGRCVARMLTNFWCGVRWFGRGWPAEYNPRNGDFAPITWRNGEAMNSYSEARNGR